MHIHSLCGGAVWWVVQVQLIYETSRRFVMVALAVILTVSHALKAAMLAPEGGDDGWWTASGGDDCSGSSSPEAAEAAMISKKTSLHGRGKKPQ